MNELSDVALLVAPIQLQAKTEIGRKLVTESRLKSKQRERVSSCRSNSFCCVSGGLQVRLKMAKKHGLCSNHVLLETKKIYFAKPFPFKTYYSLPRCV